MLNSPPSDGPGWSEGMYFSVNCCDDKVTAHTAEVIDRRAAEYPAFRSLALTEFHLGAHIADLGAGWGARPAGPAEHRPVTSELPTLILAGEFDQNTPAFWGRLAGETLSNHHSIEFPGGGHGSMFDAEAAPIIKGFLEEPSARPDDSALRARAGKTFVA
jgi:pimeloyl-ACP methyl ester carboxylesterase